MKNIGFAVKLKAFVTTLVTVAILSVLCALGLYFYIGGDVKAKQINDALSDKLVLGGTFTVHDIIADQDYKYGWLKNGKPTVFALEADGEYHENNGAVFFDERTDSFTVVGVGKGKIIFENALDGTVKFEFPYSTKFSSPDTEPLIRSGYPLYADDGIISADELKRITEISVSSAGEFDVSDFGLSALERVIIPVDGVVTLNGAEALGKSVKFYVSPEHYSEYMENARWSAYKDRIFPAVNTDKSFINVALDLCGGSIDGKSVITFAAERGALPLNEYVPSRKGYTFTGYSNGDSVVSVDTSLENDIKLYAEWSENSYTVVYEDNKFDISIGIPQERNVLYSELFNIAPALEKTGYVFLYWRHGNDVYPPDDEYSMLAGESVNGEKFVLEAAWEAYEYDIIYDKNCDGEVSGMPEKTANVPFDEQAVITSEIPLRAGYTFSGWSIQKNGDVTHRGGDKVISLSSDGAVTFYAVWIANTYTITFDPAGGEQFSPITVTYGSEYSLREPMRNHYWCTGWYFQNGVKCPAYGVWSTAADVTLYAAWKPNTGAMYGNNDRISVSSDNPKNNGCDTLDLKKLLGFTPTEYIQMGYTKISFTLNVTMSEEEKGYQEVYLSTKPKTTACVWKVTDIEHGGTKLEKNPGIHTFNFDVPLSQCSDVMYVNYGSNGSSGLWWGNDWVKHALSVILQVN